jgi:hypothetical protein
MGRLVPNAVTKIVAMAALAWFVAGGVGAVMPLGVTKSETSFALSVDRSGKGDRLPSVATSKLRTNGPSSVASTRTSPSFGCDSAFCRIAEPRQARIFRRCTA